MALMGSVSLSSLCQTEIAKRLNVICAQLIPFLSQEVGEPSGPARCAELLWGPGEGASLPQPGPALLCPHSTSSRWSRLWSERSR